MTKHELFKLAIGSVPEDKIQPLHKAMMEECCELTIEKEQLSIEDQVSLVRLTFIQANAIMRGIVISGLNQADTVTINYRGLSVTLDKNSHLTKLLEAWQRDTVRT